jgi:hypothetical protein
MVCCGCVSSRPHRLSEQHVIQVAQQIGLGHGQDLRGYRAPDAFFDARDQTWYVSFAAKKGYEDRYPWHGGFGVEVNDLTGGATYREHIWK